MVYKKIAITFIFTILNIFVYSTNIEKIRELYTKAYLSELNCKLFGENLTKETKSCSLIDAYTGCYFLMKCKFSKNPLQRINYFVVGKTNIEQAIKMNPKSVELRFLRYSVQRQLPRFLFYFSDINNDLEFIRENVNKIQNHQTKKFIIQSMATITI